MTAGFIIGATLRSGWNARHEAQNSSPFSSQAAAVHRHFCPSGSLTTSKAASAPWKKQGRQGFPWRRKRQQANAPPLRLPVRSEAKDNISISRFNVEKEDNPRYSRAAAVEAPAHHSWRQ